MGAKLGGAGNVPLRSQPPARGDVRHRHPSSHRFRLAPHRPCFQFHAYRHHRPLPPHVGPQHLLPHGLGRQRPSHRAPRPKLFQRPLRPARALRAQPRSRALGQRRRPAAQSVAPELHRAVPEADRRGRARLPIRLAARGAHRRLESGIFHHRRALPPRRPLEFSRSLPQRPRLFERSAHHVGRRFPNRRRSGRGGRPQNRRPLSSPAVRRRWRHPNRSSSPPRARSCSSPVSASPLIPRTRATNTSSAAPPSRPSSTPPCPSSPANWWTRKKAPAS